VAINRDREKGLLMVIHLGRGNDPGNAAGVKGKGHHIGTQFPGYGGRAEKQFAAKSIEVKGK